VQGQGQCFPSDLSSSDPQQFQAGTTRPRALRLMQLDEVKSSCQSHINFSEDGEEFGVKYPGQ